MKEIDITEWNGLRCSAIEAADANSEAGCNRLYSVDDC
jgi:hypothetical protein